MKFSFLVPSLFLLALEASVGAAAGASSSICDVQHANSVLENLPTGKSFCSSLLYSNGDWETKTITVTITEKCVTRTSTKLVHATSTDIAESTTVLPVVTVTVYSSTVLVASGPSRTIDKRTATAAAAPSNYYYPTPTALSTCAPQTLSSACWPIIKPTAQTSTVTYTKSCTVTQVTTTTTTDRRTTVTTPFTEYPPPLTVSATGVLTTTVPAACAGSPYDAAGGNGVGNSIFVATYPDFPQTAVECCVLCYARQNCVASGFIASVLECEFLTQTNATAAPTGVSRQCPLGIEDYNFGSPVPGGNVYPGPCGV